MPARRTPRTLLGTRGRLSVCSGGRGWMMTRLRGGATCAHAGGGDSAGPDRLERVLASAISRLFYTHRRELFHIWHSHFDPEGTGSIAADEFVAAIRALDAADGTGMLSEEATARLAETPTTTVTDDRLRGVCEEHRGFGGARARHASVESLRVNNNGRRAASDAGPARVRGNRVGTLLHGGRPRVEHWLFQRVVCLPRAATHTDSSDSRIKLKM